MRPTGLYVHIPFCVRRCSYCNFASSVYDAGRAERYLSALAEELALRVGGLQPRTIYIGGGTPTSLSTSQLRVLFDEIRTHVDTAGLQEFTLEANPGTLSMEKLLLCRDQGVTRISLGVQTFADTGLQVLGRMHDARQARTAVALVQEVGFASFSLDLIYGWPGQDPAAWTRDLERAVALDPPHMSCYGLTYEPGTRLRAERDQGHVQDVSEEADREFFDATGAFLEGEGRGRYEISSFCLPGHACQHNINYWQGGEYIGVGAGAHSHEDGLRHANSDDVETYIQMLLQDMSARVFEERLPPERRARECAVIWLRLTEGIEAAAFAERTGFDLEGLLGSVLPHLVEAGWLEWNGPRTHLRLTPMALPVADSVLAELVL